MKKNNILKILKNWKNPLFLRNIFLFKFESIINRNKKGFHIFEEEWDNLIILDACRYDIFKSEYDKGGIKGTLSLKKSKGSHTTTFLRKNFIKDKYKNLVYLAGNPYVDIILKGKIYKIISVWKNGWNEKYGTVLPETMYEYAIDAIISHPNKKLIIHFMQPHHPYLGFKISEATMGRFRERALTSLSNERMKRKYKDTFFSFYGKDLYAIMNKKTHLKLYRRNLKIVMEYVMKLVDLLPGKTVITSDHGEAIGEFFHPFIPVRIYGHNKYFKISKLIEVPWLIIEQKDKDLSRIKELKDREKLLNIIKDLKISKKV